VATQTIGLSAFILHERGGPHTYDQAGLTYDQLGILYDSNPPYIRSFQGKAYLMNPFSYQTIQFQARMLGANVATLSMRSRLANQTIATLSMRTFIRNTAFISSQSRISVVTNQSINFTGRITPCVRFTAQARISQVRPVDIQFMALLRPAGHIRLQARILHYHQEELSSQARLSQYNVFTTTTRARIIYLSTIDLLARIKQHYTQLLASRTRIAKKSTKTVRIRGKIWPYSRLMARARIKDVSWKRRYINALTKPLAQGTIPGRGDLLRHTNGNIYCVYADVYMNAVSERRLYLSISTDNGLTWGTRIQLTSGYIDNMPSLLQLDTSSTTSDIGIAFVRGNPRNIYRLIFTTTGTVSFSPQPIMYGAYTTNNAIYPNLVKLTSGKYRIYYLSNALSSYLAYSDSPSTVYTGTTQWSSVAAKYPGGVSSNYMASLSVRRHADSGHFIAIVTYMTAKDGATSPVSYLDANMVYALAMTASADEGVNWSTLQVMDSSSDTHLLSLKEKSCPISGDFTELSDGSIGLLYQKGDVHQVIDTQTSVTYDSYTRCAGVIYDTLRETLIIAEANTDSYGDRTLYGGLLFCKRNTQGVFEVTFELNPRSTPPVWSTILRAIALSPDSRYLLLAADGGISVLDMQAESHEDWTFQEFRQSTCSFLKGNDIAWADWLSNTKIAFGYSSGQASGYTWGGAFDLTDPESTYYGLYATSSGSNNWSTNHTCIIQDGVIFAICNGYLVASDANTGAFLSSYYPGSSLGSNTLVYDALNSECLVSTSTVLYCVGFNWITKVLSLQRSFSESSGNPRILQSGDYFGNAENNIIIPPESNASDYSVSVYNPLTQTVIGFIHGTDITPGLSIYDDNNQYSNPKILDVDGKQWLIWTGGSAGLCFMPIKNIGKLRYGVFVYNQTTKQLEEGDAAFYDIENVRTINSEDYNQLEFPRLVSRTDGALLIYCRLSDITRASQPFAPIIALGWTDGMTLSMRGRIVLPTSIYMRGRISFSYTKTLSLQGHLVPAGHIQFQSRILNSYTKTFDMTARIKQTYSATLDMQAFLRGAGHFEARARLLHARSYAFTAKARILVTPLRTVAFRARLTHLQSLTLKARLIPKRSIYLRAKISHSYTKTLSSKAHIHILGRPTISFTAIIQKQQLNTLALQGYLMHGSAPEMRGRIAQRQGWPEPDSGDEQWYVFTETALRIRANIGDVTYSSASFSGRGRIRPFRLTTLSTMANVVLCNSIQMQANIKPWRSYVSLPCTFDVQKLVTKRIRMVFYTQGFYKTSALTMRANIERTITARFTGHFIVPAATITSSVITVSYSSQLKYVRQFSIKAFILDQ